MIKGFGFLGGFLVVENMAVPAYFAIYQLF